MNNKKNSTKDSASKSCYWKKDSFPFGFIKRLFCKKTGTVEKDKKIRKNLSEKKIDKMVKDSFPASDSPSTY